MKKAIAGARVLGGGIVATVIALPSERRMLTCRAVASTDPATNVGSLPPRDETQLRLVGTACGFVPSERPHPSARCFPATETATQKRPPPLTIALSFHGTP